MKVKILVSFVGTHGGRKYRLRAGDELTMPEGADWVRAGFAEPMAPEPETPKRARRKTGKAAEGDE